MLAKFSRLLAALVYVVCVSSTLAVVQTEATELSGVTLATVCKGRDGWSDVAPPMRIHGNTYYVGTCGISVLLITSAKGHVLIDSATAEATPSILANIRSLGFDPRDVKLIIGSHEHIDHMGGFAGLKVATRAQLLVREPARAALENGRTDPADPQMGSIPNINPVRVDRAIADGEIVWLGDIALTTIATPGHTSGSTSWSWKSCEKTGCVSIVYADSMTAVAADGYRFSDHPERVAPFLTTFDRVAALECDLLITPHPSVSRLFERLSGNEALIDKTACRRLAELSRRDLEARLAKDKSR